MRWIHELGMFLDIPGQSEASNRQSLVSSVDWWCQIGLGGPGIYLTRLGLIMTDFGRSELGMFLDLPDQSEVTN